MAEPASKLTERLLAFADETDLIDADWTRESVANLAREAASRIDRLEREWDHALDPRSEWQCEVRTIVERAERAESALKQAEQALDTIKRDNYLRDHSDDWEQLAVRHILVALHALAVLSGQDKQECEHRDTHFDRSLCACGAMHDYCNDCGKALYCPLDVNAPVWDESQEGVQASRPEDLPVPANADKRYEELDGG